MGTRSRNPRLEFRANLRMARHIWPGQIHFRAIGTLRTLSECYGMSLANGDLQLLDGRWYVTNSGLIHLAARKGCSGIRVQPIKEFCDSATSRWIFKAVVYKKPGSKGFVGYGDANPSNVSPLVRGAEMRVAETRAVDQIDEKALFNLRGVVRTSHVTLNGRTFQNLEAFAPAADWEELSCSEPSEGQQTQGNASGL